MNKKGFTLVELLAVIAILAILVIMALPAVLKMFTQARVDTFNNELNTLIRTIRQQYLLTGGQAGTYSKDSNPLSLTGNSSLNYCITINGQGQITELKATNGSYKYESNGIVSETSSSDIEDAESGYELICSGGSGSGSSITYVNRQNEGSITVGDEVAIDTEHFYVISSDLTSTVLLAKYSLLVGDVYNSECAWNGHGTTCTLSLIKTLTSSDPGYGLQNESAKGYYDGGTDRTGVVAFSGKGYWDNRSCVWNGSNGATCTGTGGLKSGFINSSNGVSATDYTTPYPYVYNNSLSNVEPSYYNLGAQDNGYTIAYYVEEYINTLKTLGAPSSATGRLLAYEEASELSSTIKGNWSYWLGSAYNHIDMPIVSRGGAGGTTFYSQGVLGVRPVIVIPTSLIVN